MKFEDAVRISADRLAQREENGCRVLRDGNDLTTIKSVDDEWFDVTERYQEPLSQFTDWEPVNPGMCGEENRELLHEYARSKGIDPVLEGWV